MTTIKPGDCVYHANQHAVGNELKGWCECFDRSERYMTNSKGDPCGWTTLPPLMTSTPRVSVKSTRTNGDVVLCTQTTHPNLPANNAWSCQGLATSISTNKVIASSYSLAVSKSRASVESASSASAAAAAAESSAAAELNFRKAECTAIWKDDMTEKPHYIFELKPEREDRDSRLLLRRRRGELWWFHLG